MGEEKTRIRLSLAHFEMKLPAGAELGKKEIKNVDTFALKSYPTNWSHTQAVRHILAP